MSDTIGGPKRKPETPVEESAGESQGYLDTKTVKKSRSKSTLRPLDTAETQVRNDTTKDRLRELLDSVREERGEIKRQEDFPQLPLLART